jgi:hypothetical protein
MPGLQERIRSLRRFKAQILLPRVFREIKNKRSPHMNFENILNYKTAVAVFKKWLRDGLINASEFSAIETKTAEKYGLNSSSIYRTIHLTSPGN